MKKYKYRKYKFYYPILFNLERKKLEKIIPKNVKVEHIGSTAVKGLGGKGIIDILISVPKNLIDKTKNLLIDEGYGYHGGTKGSIRLYFVKDKFYFVKYRVHMQLTTKKSKVEKEALKFRENLRKSDKAREEYVKAKKEAVKISKGEGEKYCKHKNIFINKILKD